MTTRVCRICGDEKALDLFAVRKPGVWRRECLDCKSAADRDHYQRNREHRLAKVRGRYVEKRDGILLYAKEYRDANRAKVAAGKRRCYEADKPRAFARTREWYRLNPGYKRVIEAARKAQRRRSPGRVTLAEWRALAASYCGLCVYCNQRPAQLTQDHITPLTQGGLHEIDNLAPACRSCNSRKGARSLLLSLALRAA